MWRGSKQAFDQICSELGDWGKGQLTVKWRIFNAYMAISDTEVWMGQSRRLWFGTQGSV